MEEKAIFPPVTGALVGTGVSVGAGSGVSVGAMVGDGSLVSVDVGVDSPGVADISGVAVALAGGLVGRAVAGTTGDWVGAAVGWVPVGLGAAVMNGRDVAVGPVGSTAVGGGASGSISVGEASVGVAGSGATGCGDPGEAVAVGSAPACSVARRSTARCVASASGACDRVGKRPQAGMTARSNRHNKMSSKDFIFMSPVLNQSSNTRGGVSSWRARTANDKNRPGVVG